MMTSKIDMIANITNASGRDKYPPKRYLMVIKSLMFLYSHFWPMAEAARMAGWDVCIAADCDADPSRVTDAGMRYIPLPAANGMGQLFTECKSAIKLSAILGEIKPDIVHFIYLKNVLVGGIVARLHRIPAVLGAITGLGSLFADDRLLYRAARRAVVFGLRVGFRGSNSVIAFENGDDRRYFVSCGAISDQRCIIIPGAGVDRDWATYQPWRGNTPVILCAARMIRDKGILDLVEACRILLDRGINFELWLAGRIYSANPTSLTEKELKSIEEEGIGRCLGHCSDMRSLLQAASIFCLPTRYREGLPRVLVEASAMGRPSVTTDLPGCRDIVKHEVSGLIVQPGDVGELADALQYLLLNRDTREEMGRAARQIFESNYTLDSVLQALNGGYKLLGIPLHLKTRADAPVSD